MQTRPIGNRQPAPEALHHHDQNRCEFVGIPFLSVVKNL
jgi:hypothetical protein